MTLPSAAETRLSGNALSAYNVCLGLEKIAKDRTEKERIQARVLGYLIIHAPSPTATSELLNVIHSCSNDHDKLFKLGEAFINYYIRPFKKSKGHTPASSDHPSRPSFDEVTKKILLGKIIEAPKNHTEAKRLALIRDGFRCVATGMYDSKILKTPNFEQPTPRNQPMVHTECAHIVPQSTYFNVSTNADKRDYSASVLAVLKRFGYDVDNLNGEKVHSLFNVMTMDRNAHDAFDRLNLWFQATQTKDCYITKTSSDWYYPLLKKKITFQSTPDLPAPSPELLALHAACATVAHLSGAGAYIDELDEDTDSLPVLTHDGQSSEILNNAIIRSLGSLPPSNCVGDGNDAGVGGQLQPLSEHFRHLLPNQNPIPPV
ncbi:hypothetical protein VNI00_013995 [Paramarasmius palmivorus]|uniref:HNH nuclease domain-containing protein n=1 Tax=Paramarasmius palmivorus TaxID=297713 RepID=A0AAW0BVV9_9AGAR